MKTLILQFSTNAFFRAALSHLWESSLVGVAVLTIIAACRRAPAGWRRTLGWIGLLNFAVPGVAFTPVRQALGYLMERLTAVSPAAVAVRIPGYRLLAAGDASYRLPSGLSLAIIGIWMLGAMFLFGRWVIRGIALRRAVLAAAGPASESLAGLLGATVEKFGFGAAPLAVIPSDHRGPGILGAFSPLLVIPEHLETVLNPAELESILIHELVHLRRHDNVWSALRAAFVAVFWFNPVVWLLSRSIAIETEKDCDETVVRMTGAPRAYADGILKTVHYSLGLPDPGMTGAAGHSISSRIRNILTPQSKNPSPLMKTISLFAACLAAVLVSYADNPPASAAAPAPAVGERQIYNVSDVDQAPKVRTQVPPAYPSDMAAKGINATVVVDFLVDTRGRVRDAYVVESTRSEFNRSALNAIMQWTFIPGSKAGHLVVTHLSLPIKFAPSAD